MKTITVEHSEQILKKMCDIVGIDYSKKFFEQDYWFEQKSITQQEENDFIDWLGDFLYKHSYFHSKKLAKHEASKIVGNYGWKLI